MRRLLAEWGHEAICADGLDAAIEAARGARIGLVVSDYQLGPATNGNDAILQLRRRLGAPLPAIIVTGGTRARAADGAREHAIPLLLKPVEPQALEALIVRAAQAEAARREKNDASLPA